MNSIIVLRGRCFLVVSYILHIVVECEMPMDRRWFSNWQSLMFFISNIMGGSSFSEMLLKVSREELQFLVGLDE